jgi:hypothetical protein
VIDLGRPALGVELGLGERARARQLAPPERGQGFADP